MNRQQMLSILNTMSDDNLVEALSAVGVECEQCGDPLDFGDEVAEGLESWGARDVSVPTSERPPIVDKSKIFVEPSVAQRVRGYVGDGTEDLGELSEYLHHSQGF